MASAGIGDRVEGVHAVAEAAAAGRITRLFVERNRLRREGIGDIVERVRAGGADVEVVDRVRDVARTDAPQGLVAEARPIETLALEALTGPACALLVLDHVEDPHNAGAAARSALASGMTGLIVPDRRGAPLGAVAFKAAAGALEHLPVAMVSSVADAVERLKRRSVWTVGLDAAGDRSLFGLDLLTEPVAVVVGAEGSGLARLVGERVDVLASIPMSGPMASLNASVSAALACFEVQRVRAAASSGP